MELLIVGLPLSALVGWFIGKNKGRASDGAMLGFLLGPLGWLIVAVGKSEGMRKCPFCAEEVKSEATVCRFCSRELPPVPSKAPVPPVKSRPVLVIALLIIGVAVILAMFGWQEAKPVKPPPEHYHYANGVLVHD
jgi:hypothetical protein